MRANGLNTGAGSQERGKRGERVGGEERKEQKERGRRREKERGETEKGVTPIY